MPPPGAPVLGVDLGATKIAAALVDPRGLVLASARVATPGSQGPEAVVDAVAAAAQRCLAGQASAAAALGIGVAAQVDEEQGVVRFAPNMPGWNDVPLAAPLSKVLAVPVAVTNDVRAVTWGEWRHGAGQGVQDLVVVFVGTGIGGGVVSHGQVLRGAAGCGAELGHVVIRAGGRKCTCPGSGCLEAYAGGWAIAASAREAVLADPGGGEGLLQRAGRTDAITAATVAEAANAGDPLAERLVAEAADDLGVGLVSIVNAFNPRLLVLGGGVLDGMPGMFERAAAVVRDRAIRAAVRDLRIVPAALGPQAGVVGAAAYARERLAGA